jgi:hypothetical protein
MLQTMMQLSAVSRTTSISNSFQPSTDSSTSTSLVGESSSRAIDDLDQLLAVVGDAAAAAAQGEAGADDGGIADAGLDIQRLLQRARDFGLRAFQPDLLHRHAEQLAVLGHHDGLALGADQLDAVFLQHAVVGQVERAVQRGLAAHRRQQRIGRSLAMIFSTVCQLIGSM